VQRGGSLDAADHGSSIVGGQVIAQVDPRASSARNRQKLRPWPTRKCGS
jgi:hypothetical protein